MSYGDPCQGCFGNWPLAAEGLHQHPHGFYVPCDRAHPHIPEAEDGMSVGGLDDSLLAVGFRWDAEGRMTQAPADLMAVVSLAIRDSVIQRNVHMAAWDAVQATVRTIRGTADPLGRPFDRVVDDR